MKKFIPYLLFSATTFHTFLGALPVTAMGCNTKTDKAEVVCNPEVKVCQEKVSDSAVN
tara:strand:- start:67 stop:240 length:174 start_codon:yes stop_codon:yes gene_type:complete